MIEFDGATKQYPDGTVAVADLRLTVPSGQITAFVGPSGCGKTTSLRMVNRMVEPTAGRVLVGGEDIAGRDPAQLRRSIGYVIQHAGLFPHRTVADNVATVPVLQGLGRRAARTRALELLEVVGLSAAVGGRYPAQLSGGQQQRVGVARALAADPPILLMDEPFSAVDPVVREGLQKELLRLQQDIGKTIVIVTHDVDEAITLGDRVAVFTAGGRLAQFDTPAQLLASPADDQVAGLVGRDRGFRGLSFDTAATLPEQPVDRPVEGFRLELDAGGAPTGWTDGRTTYPVGGTFEAGQSVRAVTDLTILSPVSAAVRVEAGRAVGVVTQAALAAHLRERTRRAAASGEVPPGG